MVIFNKNVNYFFYLLVFNKFNIILFIINVYMTI